MEPDQIGLSSQVVQIAGWFLTRDGAVPNSDAMSVLPLECSGFISRLRGIVCCHDLMDCGSCGLPATGMRFHPDYAGLFVAASTVRLPDRMRKAKVSIPTTRDCLLLPLARNLAETVPELREAVGFHPDYAGLFVATCIHRR